MTHKGRGLGATVIIAVAALGSAPLLAQQTNTIGPPELRDFRLPGERTTPPAQTPEPQPEPRQPAATTPPPATPRAEPRPVPANPGPAPITPRAAERPAPRAAEPARPEAPPAAPVPVPAVQRDAPPLATQPQPPAQPLPQEAAPVPVPAPAAADPAPQQAGWNWLWLAVPAALALIGFFAFGRRRRDDVEDAPAEAEAEAAPPRRAEGPPPAPRPVAKPALKLPPKVAAVPPAPPQPVGPRAQLEVQFIPARASATEDAAVVEFELVLKNVGDAPARNIRIDTRMFNASATQEMADFLRGAIHETSGSPHVQIPPGEEMRLQSAMAMPKQDVREILMQGQRLFVPAVASIVAWDWGSEGRGRTTQSWLVGRESQTPSAKMGAFRLDLGPRIYRQVGVRPLKLVA